MRERLRYRHCSLRTEQTYVYWVRRFIRFDSLRPTREMCNDAQGRSTLEPRLAASTPPHHMHKLGARLQRQGLLIEQGVAGLLGKGLKVAQ